MTMDIKTTSVFDKTASVFDKTASVFDKTATVFTLFLSFLPVSEE